MDSRFNVEQAQAIFRGVPFHVRKRTRDGGRRGPTHEAPQRDEPDGEDLGRKVRVFKLDALIIGTGDTDAAMQADCVKRSVALMAALEDKSGPGIYRDPWHGSWKMICRSVSAVDDEDHQFVTAFSITLEESGSTRYPLSLLDTAERTETQAAKLLGVAVKVVKRAMSLANRPKFVMADALSLAGDAASGLQDAGLVQLDTAEAIGVDDFSAASAQFSVVSSLTGRLADGSFADSLASLFRSASASSYSRRASLGDASATWSAFSRMADWGADLGEIAPSTANRKAQADNRVAMVNLVRQLAVAEEARALSASTWESQDQAVTMRNVTLGHIDAVMSAAGASGEDEVFVSAQDLAVAVTADVAARAPAARVRTAAFATTLPACVVAHKLLGDGRFADDIVRRNGIVNAAFVPANQPLEYLSDA